MTMRSFTVDQLCLSPLNVRTNQEDAEATEALEASIEVHGLLFPLIVHPLAKRGKATQRYGVFAGGRRFRAIARLIAACRLAPDFPIDAIVRDIEPSAITELSLAENLLRRDLRPYEIHAAVARAHAQGAAPEDIASHFGQRLSWVRQHLRLGALAPEIFAAYADGKLSLDQAHAYGATADTTLQSAAFAALSVRRDWERDGRAIRAFLKVGDHELAGLLAFVGEDAYRAAGGNFELDLFADDAETRGRVSDEPLLRTLAETKMAALRQEIRVAAQTIDLRFAAEPPKFGQYVDNTLELHPADRGRGDDRRIALPDGDVIATLDLGNRGEPALRWWWASRKAKGDAEKVGRASGSPPPSKLVQSISGNVGGALDDRANPGYAKAAQSALRDAHGLTAEGVQIMRSLRRELLRALLITDANFQGSFGRNYLIWSQLRQALADDASAVTGTLHLATEWTTSADHIAPDVLAPHFDAMEAHKIWSGALEQIKAQPFITNPDAAQGFVDYIATSAEMKCRASAVLAGLSLLRSCAADGWAIPAHDVLAEFVDGHDTTLRELWQPTPAFVALFPKMQRLAMVQPFVGAGFYNGMQKLNSQTLTDQAAEILRGGNDDGPRFPTDRWVHPLLSFTAHDTLAHAFDVAAE